MTRFGLAVHKTSIGFVQFPLLLQAGRLYLNFHNIFVENLS